MADNLKIFKEGKINEYMADYLADKSEELDLNTIKKDIGNLIGEQPALKLNYVKEEILNEASGEKESVENLESIEIIFTVEQDINGNSIPFPITQKFIIR